MQDFSIFTIICFKPSGEDMILISFGLILVSHGGLSKGLLSSVEMIMGPRSAKNAETKISKKYLEVFFGDCNYFRFHGTTKECKR